MPRDRKYSNGDDRLSLSEETSEYFHKTSATTRVGAASALNLVLKALSLNKSEWMPPREGQQESVSFNRLESQNHMPKLPT